MAKVSLIVIGIIILIATFFVLEVYISSDAKSDIRTADSLCNAEVTAFGFKVPIGSWGQKLLGAQEDCQKVHYYMLLITYGWIGYALGGLLFILGLVLSGGRKEYHEEKHSSRHISKHCGECGSKLEGHEKHCPECGEKI